MLECCGAGCKSSAWSKECSGVGGLLVLLEKVCSMSREKGRELSPVQEDSGARNLASARRLGARAGMLEQECSAPALGRALTRPACKASGFGWGGLLPVVQKANYNKCRHARSLRLRPG